MLIYWGLNPEVGASLSLDACHGDVEGGWFKVRVAPICFSYLLLLSAAWIPGDPFSSPLTWHMVSMLASVYVNLVHIRVFWKG